MKRKLHRGGMLVPTFDLRMAPRVVISRLYRSKLGNSKGFYTYNFGSARGVEGCPRI